MTKRVTCWYILLLLLVGCGSGGGGDEVVGTGGSAQNGGTYPNPPAAEFGSLVVRQTLLNRAVATEIDSVRITGYGIPDAGGEILEPVGTSAIYGPVVLPKQATYELEDVPVEVESIRIEYLQDESVRGVFSQNVTIAPDEPFEIVDPNYQDLAQLFTRIEFEYDVEGLSDEFPGETIAILPESPVRYSLKVRGFSSEGGNGIDITHLVALESSNPSVLDVGYGGNQFGLLPADFTFGGTPGNVNLIARFIDLEQTVPVEVLYPAPPFITEIQFVQDYGNLSQGVPTQLTALGKFSDGSTRIITDQVEWSVPNFGSEPPVLEITPGGVATALGSDGNAIIGIYYRPNRFGHFGSIFLDPADHKTRRGTPPTPSAALTGSSNRPPAHQRSERRSSVP